MFRRLTTSTVILLVLAVFFTGISALRELNRSNHRSVESILKTAAAFVREAWDEESSPGPISDRMLQVYRDDLGNPLRTTVVDLEGKVVFDSAGVEAEPDNHAGRPEIAAVIHGRPSGQSLRFSRSTGQDLLYYAIPSQSGRHVIRVALPLIYQTETFRKLSRTVIAVAVLAVLLSVAIAYLLTRRYSRALQSLCEGAEKMGGGSLSARIAERNGILFPEIRRLTYTFNDMAASLENQHIEMEEKNARLTAILNAMMEPLLLVDADKRLLYANEEAGEVFGRKIDPEQNPYPQVLLTHADELDHVIDLCLKTGEEQEVQLHFMTPAAEKPFRVQASPIRSVSSTQGVVVVLHDVSPEEEAALLRRDFVANVTHELKTPLTSIRGYIETLRNQPSIPEEKRKRFMDIMESECMRLEDLINDILSLAEIEREEFRNGSEFDLRELIDEVLVLLDEQASERKVALVTDDGPPLPVSAERHRIKQILINLVDNGIKYGKEHGTVAIAAEREADGRVRIEVRDDGPGIPAEAQKRLFERFYRVDKGRSRELGGTGLGLSIVKHIARHYGGDTRVESEPGRGAAFIITLHI